MNNPSVPTFTNFTEVDLRYINSKKMLNVYEGKSMNVFLYYTRKGLLTIVNFKKGTTWKLRVKSYLGKN